MHASNQQGGKKDDALAVGRWRAVAIKLGMYPQVFDRYVRERGLDYVTGQYEHLRGNPNKPKTVSGALWNDALRYDIKGYDEKTRAEIDAMDAAARKAHEERTAQIVAARREADLKAAKEVDAARDEFRLRLSQLSEAQLGALADEVGQLHHHRPRNAIARARRENMPLIEVLSQRQIRKEVTELLDSRDATPLRLAIG